MKTLAKTIQCWDGDGSVPPEILEMADRVDAMTKERDAALKHSDDLDKQVQQLEINIHALNNEVRKLKEDKDVAMASQLREEAAELRVQLEDTMSYDDHQDALSEKEKEVRDEIEEERRHNLAYAGHDIAELLNRMGCYDIEEVIHHLAKNLRFDLLAPMAHQIMGHARRVEITGASGTTDMAAMERMMNPFHGQS